MLTTFKKKHRHNAYKSIHTKMLAAFLLSFISFLQSENRPTLFSLNLPYIFHLLRIKSKSAFIVGYL